MSIPPENIEPGKCYLTIVGGHHRVQRVVTITPSGHVVFEVRRKLHDPTLWPPEERGLRVFAASVEREVPCDWTPDEGGRLMSVPVSALEVGKCYLTNAGRVWRIVGLLSDGRILYEHRPGHLHQARTWKPGVLTGPLVETVLEREVPCHWRPEADGNKT